MPCTVLQCVNKDIIINNCKYPVPIHPHLRRCGVDMRGGPAPTPSYHA